MKKHKRYTPKTVGRMAIIFLFFGTVISTFLYRLFFNLYQVNNLNKELVKLEEEQISLTDREEELEADIKRLSDPEYIARFAREKYFYSKEGEIILRIEV